MPVQPPPALQPPPAAFEVAGERLELHAERAAYWAAEKTLLVADTHWGKAATFRSVSIPLPDTEVDSDLGRLSAVLDRTGAERLVVLGDMLHHRKGRDEATFAAIARWRAAHADLEVVLIEGNHDRSSGRVPADWRVRTVRGALSVGPFVLSHYPDADPAGYVLAGHLHPKVKLRGAAGEVKLPCWWFGDEAGVFPAFGSLIDGAPVRPAKTDRVFVVADDEVVDVSAPAAKGRRIGAAA